MATPLEERVRAAIDEVRDPCSLAQAIPIGISEMGMVTDVRLGEPRADGRRDVELVLRVTAPGCMYVPFMDRSIKAAVGELEEIGEISTDWDPEAEWRPGDIAAPAQERIAESRQRRLRQHRERRESRERERDLQETAR
jgi:metal-sulfur cluster biosynthetic enzyme